jgi:ribosomal protein S18 acetylase RimI-like enzyme
MTKGHVATDEPIAVRLAEGAADWEWLAASWRETWSGETVVSRGTVHKLTDQAALIAWQGDARVGVATYRAGDRDWELTSISAVTSGRGIGTALMNAVEEAARAGRAARLWLITTNDNLDALRFYQRRGYRLVAVHAGAVDVARKLKPSIPETGNYDIPLRDEIELEKRFE